MHIDPETHIAKDARILIVDDERKSVAALGQIISRAGYGICITITDPRKAVAKFQKMQPDLLLLDWHLGELSGLDVLNEIREQVPAEAMPPVLVLTADDSAATKRKALKAGVSDFLAKPLDVAEVLLRIHNLLQLRIFRQREQSERRSLEEQVDEKTAKLEQTLAELKESQHQVIQQERIRALAAMSSGIAHDFNNALTIILGYSEMFKDRDDILKNPAGALDAFNVIGRAASDSAEVVRRLREFHRPYRPGEDDRKPVDVRKIVEEAVLLSVPRWRTQSQAHGVYIDLKTELGEVPTIYAAAPELREVMMNLIFNAVDAMPGGGRITIRTGTEGELVFFEVEDTGMGMSEQTRKNCMEPFYTTKGKTGTGLGLATTHGIVRRHEGYIGIDSDLGQGTRFTVLLPVGKPVEASIDAAAKEGEGATEERPAGLESHEVADAAVAAMKDATWATVPVEAEEMPVPGSRVPPHSLRVLVVDDQAEICYVLRHYLERDSHKVETAADGREALEKFRGAVFDVVITDRAMPKMNGDQLASAIKGMHPGEPVIQLTGFVQEPGKQSPDVDVQLDKPASLQKIRQAIKKVMAA